MEITEKRRLNLLRISKDYKFQKDLADALDLAPAYLSQLLAEPAAKGSRNIGSKAARKIEKRLGLTAFSLDEYPNQVSDEVGQYRTTKSFARARKIAKLEDWLARGMLAPEDLDVVWPVIERLVDDKKQGGTK